MKEKAISPHEIVESQKATDDGNEKEKHEVKFLIPACRQAGLIK